MKKPMAYALQAQMRFVDTPGGLGGCSKPRERVLSVLPQPALLTASGNLPTQSLSHHLQDLMGLSHLRGNWDRGQSGLRKEHPPSREMGDLWSSLLLPRRSV